MSRLLAKYLLAKMLFAAWLFISVSPALFLLWLLDGHDDARSALTWITAPWGAVCLVGSWWLGQTTAHYIIDENRKFFDAVRRSLYDLRLRLAFVPIVRHFFAPDEDMTHWDDDDKV